MKAHTFQYNEIVTLRRTERVVAPLQGEFATVNSVW